MPVQEALDFGEAPPKAPKLSRAVRRPLLRKLKEPDSEERGKIHPMEGEPECPRRKCRGVNHRYYDWNMIQGITAECQECGLIWHPKSGVARTCGIVG